VQHLSAFEYRRHTIKLCVLADIKFTP
jgi:hypothetical protein